MFQTRLAIAVEEERQWVGKALDHFESGVEATHYNTHAWKVYVKVHRNDAFLGGGPNNDHDDSNTDDAVVSKVEFLLHPSFTPSKICIHQPPYEVQRMGWGTFDVEVRVSLSKKIQKIHSHDNNHDNADGISNNEPLPLDWYPNRWYFPTTLVADLHALTHTSKKKKRNHEQLEDTRVGREGDEAFVLENKQFQKEIGTNKDESKLSKKMMKKDNEQPQRQGGRTEDEAVVLEFCHYLNFSKPKTCTTYNYEVSVNDEEGNGAKKANLQLEIGNLYYDLDDNNDNCLDTQSIGVVDEKYNACHNTLQVVDGQGRSLEATATATATAAAAPSWSFVKEFVEDGKYLRKYYKKSLQLNKAKLERIQGSIVELNKFFQLIPLKRHDNMGLGAYLAGVYHGNMKREYMMELYNFASSHLRYVILDQATLEDGGIMDYIINWKQYIKQNNEGVLQKAYDLSHPLPPTERMDVFISHSWSDDGMKQARAIKRISREFQQRNNGRLPRMWLDMFCMEQTPSSKDKIEKYVACLPLFSKVATTTAVILSPSLLSRLWCLVEIYTAYMLSSSNSSSTSSQPSNSNMNVSEEDIGIQIFPLDDDDCNNARGNEHGTESISQNDELMEGIVERTTRTTALAAAPQEKVGALNTTDNVDHGDKNSEYEQQQRRSSLLLENKMLQTYRRQQHTIIIKDARCGSQRDQELLFRNLRDAPGGLLGVERYINEALRKATLKYQHEQKQQRQQQQQQGVAQLPSNVAPMFDDPLQSPYSVMIGCSKACRDLVGNRRLEVLAAMILPRYEKATSRAEKSLIVTHLVDKVQNAGGSFVKVIDGDWHQAKIQDAREKVEAVFRDLLQD